MSTRVIVGMSNRTTEHLIHKVFLKFADTNTDHIDEWCYDHFGVQGEKWDAYFASSESYNYDQYYIFANLDDAVLFTLRWS